MTLDDLERPLCNVSKYVRFGAHYENEDSKQRVNKMLRLRLTQLITRHEKNDQLLMVFSL